MKKILFLAASALMAAGLITSCGGGSAEQARQDSIRRADSIAAVRAAEQARIEAERLEDARRDSIAQANAFNNALPNSSMFFSGTHLSENLGTTLTNLGYSGLTTLELDEMEVPEIIGRYNFETDGKSINIEFKENKSPEFGGIFMTITIKGDNEALDNVYKELKAFVKRKDWGNMGDVAPVRKEGDKIKIYVEPF